MAQKENNVWHFGTNLSLNFNSNPPKLSHTSTIVSDAACASIADKNGNLLFYTNGKTIWNRKDSVMANGSYLNGNHNSSQALILKHPGPNTLYYVFHPSSRLNAHNGLNYSIVDISKNGGLGEVTSKNIQLSQKYLPDKITAVRDKAGCGYWLITHLMYSDAFYTFHIDYGGIDTTPVISNTGLYYDYNSMIGCLKVSPDGKKIAACARKLELYDFNSATGQVTNGLVIDSSVSDFFGCAFSPNGKLLYAALDYFQICQYNVGLSSASSIINSKKVICTAFGFGGLQLASDGKIYISNWNDTVLSVIRYPDIIDTGCRFVYAAINIGGYYTQLGLPNMIDNEHKINIYPYLGADTLICASDSINLMFRDTYGHTFLWNTGDTTPAIKTNKQGQYVAQAFYYCNYDTLVFSDTLTINVSIDTSKLDLGADTSLCGDTFKISTTQKDFVSYKWSNGDSLNYTTVKSSGMYRLETKSVCGTMYDTISITLSRDSVAAFSLGKDTLVCDSLISLSTAFIAGREYLWSTGDTTFSINITVNNQYWLLTSSVCNSYLDTIRIDFFKDSTLHFIGNDTTICWNSFALSTPGAAYTKYLWSTGDTTNTISTKLSGSYWLNAVSPCGIKSDSINIQLINDSSTFFDLGKDTGFCKGSLRLYIKTTFPDNKFLWSTGDTVSYIDVTQTGLYRAYVYNVCYSSSDTLAVALFTDSITPFDLGNDTMLCSGSLSLNSAYTQNATYLWSTGDTTQAILVTKEGKYRVTVTNSNCKNTYSDSVHISYFTPQPLHLPNDTSVCEDRSDSIVLFSNGIYSKYLWNIGDTTPFAIINKQGVYVLTTIDSCGNTFTDEVTVLFENCECDLFVPNAFTPDGDGLNDVFYVSEYCGLIKYRLWIFNRWGELMFETNNPNATWDGTYKGEAVPEGVYGVLIDYTFDKLLSKPEYRGNLTVIR